LIIQNSQYHRALFFNSSNSAIGSILAISTDVTNYFKLKDINESLSKENTQLKNTLNDFEAKPDSLKTDSTRNFIFLEAKVVNNSVSKRDNTITINIGSINGVKEDMAVIGGGGIIGKTRYVGEHYTLVTSILHTKSMVPASIKGKVNICTIKWDGTDPYLINLLYVPRHYNLEIGDTVITSGYSGIFPENITIGNIYSINLAEDAQFYDLKVKLINDLHKITYVEVVENLHLPKIDSLQNLVQ
jgi:rod shape-determining protein MreC